MSPCGSGRDQLTGSANIIPVSATKADICSIVTWSFPIAIRLTWYRRATFHVGDHSRRLEPHHELPGRTIMPDTRILSAGGKLRSVKDAVLPSRKVAPHTTLMKTVAIAAHRRGP